MKVFDWLARTLILILAALATLALVGSLASVSDSSMGDAFPGRIDDPAAEIGMVEATARPTEPGDGTTTIRVPAPAAPTERHEIARWLKALTYAVLALAAIVAAGMIVLARIAMHLRRIADR